MNAEPETEAAIRVLFPGRMQESPAGVLVTLGPGGSEEARAGCDADTALDGRAFRPYAKITNAIGIGNMPGLNLSVRLIQLR